MSRRLSSVTFFEKLISLYLPDVYFYPSLEQYFEVEDDRIPKQNLYHVKEHSQIRFV